MNNSPGNNDHDFRDRYRAGAQRGGFDLWETLGGLRSEFERHLGPRAGMRRGSRMSRGNVRAAILILLAEGAMHGYQIIQEIEKRSSGAWKPSAGSVYPTLQLLADEGLIQAKEADGRKTYSLTKIGKDEAASSGPAPWEASGVRESAHSMVLPKAGIRLAEALGQVARGGTPEQVEAAVTVADDARRKLYAILAEK